MQYIKLKFADAVYAIQQVHEATNQQCGRINISVSGDAAAVIFTSNRVAEMHLLKAVSSLPHESLDQTQAQEEIGAMAFVMN